MVIILSAELELTKTLKWRAWKGTFSGKVIYDSISQENPVASLRTVPPEKMKPELRAGDVVKVRAVFWGPYAESTASEVSIGLLNLDYAVPINVKMRELSVDKPPEVVKSEDPKAIYFTAFHFPTFYKFHGSWVSLPSVFRMLNSLFKRLGEELGRDMDQEALKELALKIEAIGGNLRITRERVKGNLEVPTFNGKIKYYGVLNEGEIQLLLWALKYLPLFGAGASPGMGFGHVQWVEVREPPFETPVGKFKENIRYDFDDYLMEK
ncbi:hypothetical protein EYM_05460 [Ignicoccus islandicus DSM 13165]|uniref:CRISPR-associated protein Cas6 C-terminal domain-containing protein n=1 Tax=Ignicoccus islandicus DSM 13165 TaxID=940295 RepID=A0A0U3E3U4_9CREN|nr:CRISPR system precrRNA processing endoribonuclease RAMP protein Cas6 [Ignicoccus islandicus]ALU12587.1 hypothetical protein EYM_05460 [Ignicoccus islandicus DSM 13165]